MAERPVALIDMDGTLADYSGAVQRKLEKIRSPNDPVFVAEDEDRLPWLKERIRMIKKQPNFWLDLPPLEKGFAVVDILRKLDFKLHILTRGPYQLPEAWDQKFRWCRRYIPDAEITITHDKSLVYGRILVDDWPEYIRGWLEFRPRGLVIMPDQPWNQGFTHPQVIRHEYNTHEVREALKAQRDRND